MTDSDRKPAIIIGAIVAGLLLVGVIGYFMFKGVEYKIVLTKEELQAAIDEQVPYEKDFAFIFKLTVKNTKVHLTAGSHRIGASTDVELNVRIGKNPKNLGGFIKSETALRYDQDKFCFYLLQPEVQKLQIQGIPAKYTKVVTKTSKQILQAHITDVPVYQIKDDELKMKLAKAILKKVEVVNGQLVVTLGY